MGGWTRIWVVVTTVGALVGAWAGWANYQSNMHGALRAYQQAVDQPHLRDDCAHRPAEPNPASTAFDRYLSDCRIGMPSSHSVPLDAVKHWADQREQARSVAMRGAVILGVVIAAFISATVGALFVTIGWIGRGFRKGRSP